VTTEQNLDFAEARRAIDTIVAEVTRRGKAAVIAVADSRGELIALARMDGAHTLSAQGVFLARHSFEALHQKCWIGFRAVHRSGGRRAARRRQGAFSSMRGANLRKKTLI